MGGTDFRPAFLHVDQMIKAGKFSRLRGLLYFTDGYGTFPVKMPPYDTAFVFMRDNYTDADVPPWAMKVILDPESMEDVGKILDGKDEFHRSGAGCKDIEATGRKFYQNN